MLSQYYLNFLIWETTTVLTYIVANLSFKPIKCPTSLLPCLDKCCVMRGTTFEVSHAVFTKSQDRINLRMIMLYSIAVFFMGNKYNQLDPFVNPYNLLLCLVSPVASLTMAYMGNIKGLQTSCSRHSIPKWPIMSYVVYTFVVLITVPLYVYNVYLIYAVEGVDVFVSYLSFLLLIAFFEYTLYRVWDPNRNVHIHHLFIGTMGSTICRANSPYVTALAMILYGVGIEGGCNYGFPDIFED